MRTLSHFISGLTEPRNILFAATLVAAGGVVKGYVQVQDGIDRELALRQGPPVPVAIQDFRPGRDVGPASEVQIHGEVDMSKAVAIPERGSKASRWIMVVPVFPVSPMGSAILASRDGGTSSVLAAQAERRVSDAPKRQSAIGFVTMPLAGPGALPDTPEAFSVANLGDGDAGALVTLNGQVRQSAELATLAHGAFAARGVTLADSFVAVAPFQPGRATALASGGPVRTNNDLFLLALTLLVMAGVMQVWKGVQGDGNRVRQHDPDDESDFVPPPPSRRPQFAPLASQGEILARDRIAAEREHETAVAYTAVQSLFGSIAARFRSRPSRREDESP